MRLPTFCRHFLSRVQVTIIFINGMSHKYGTEFQKNEKNGLFTNYVYIKI